MQTQWEYFKMKVYFVNIVHNISSMKKNLD